MNKEVGQLYTNPPEKEPVRVAALSYKGKRFVRNDGKKDIGHFVSNKEYLANLANVVNQQNSFYDESSVIEPACDNESNDMDQNFNNDEQQPPEPTDAGNRSPFMSGETGNPVVGFRFKAISGTVKSLTLCLFKYLI